MKKLLSLLVLISIFSCSTTQQLTVKDSDRAVLPCATEVDTAWQPPKFRTMSVAKENEVKNVIFAFFAPPDFVIQCGGTKAGFNKVLDTLIANFNKTSIKRAGFKIIKHPNNDQFVFVTESENPFKKPTTATGTYTQQLMRLAYVNPGNAGCDAAILLSGAYVSSDAGCYNCLGLDASLDQFQYTRARNKMNGIITKQPNQTWPLWGIDYFEHEIFHLAGCYHTFSYKNEGTMVQIQPASGTTIMDYPGTATSQWNLQSHSDDLLHPIGVRQAVTYIKYQNFHGGSYSINNSSPVFNVPPMQILPSNTPFIVSVSATDPDNDRLEYWFVQADSKSGGSNNTSYEYKSGKWQVKAGFNDDSFNSTVAGHFSLAGKPSALNYRTFPSFAKMRTGVYNSPWEYLPNHPSINDGYMRMAKFIADVSDGKTLPVQKDLSVKFTQLSRKFAVTSQNVATAWTAGSTQTITWNVNGTDLAPVSAAVVDVVLLSPSDVMTLVLNDTPNDGLQPIVVPNMVGTGWRLLVMQDYQTLNGFFSMNRADIAITAAPVVVTPLPPTTVPVLTLVSAVGRKVILKITPSAGSVKYSYYMDRTCINTGAAGLPCEGYKGETTGLTFSVTAPVGSHTFDVKGKDVNGVRTVSSNVVTVNIN